MERQGKRIHTGNSAAVSATGSVLCSADLLPRICAFQYGYPLLVRPLVEPPRPPLPSRYPYAKYQDDENQSEYRLGVFPARAVKAGDLPLLLTLQRVVERHRKYKDFGLLSFCGVIHAAIEAGAVAVLEWAHEQDDAFWPRGGGWADQRFQLFPRRISSQVLVWLDTHRPELYRKQRQCDIEAAIRRGHVDVLRYCYRHAPEAFALRDGLNISGGSLQVVRFLVEETSLDLQTRRCVELASSKAVEARHFYLVDYLRRYLQERGDVDKYTRLMCILFKQAVDYQWTDAIEYMRTVGEWTDDRAQRATRHHRIGPARVAALRSSALRSRKSKDPETVVLPLATDTNALRWALVDACWAGRYRMVEALLAHGAVQHDLDCICEAAKHGHVDVLGLLFQEVRATFSDRERAELVRSLVRDTPPTAESVRSGKFYAAVKLVVDREIAARDETGCWQLVDAVLYSRGNLNFARVPPAILGFLLRCILALRDPAAAAGRSSVSAMMPATLEGETETEAEDALRFAITLGRFDLIRFQHQTRAKGFTSDLVADAAGEGQLEILRLLCETRGMKCNADALLKAKANGHASIVAFLQSYGS